MKFLKALRCAIENIEVIIPWFIIAVSYDYFSPFVIDFAIFFIIIEIAGGIFELKKHGFL